MSVCACTCLCASEQRGSPELKAPFLMFSLGCGRVRREITNRLPQWIVTHKHTQNVARAVQRNVFKVDGPTKLTTLYLNFR